MKAANRRLFCCTLRGSVAQSIDFPNFVLHISMQRYVMARRTIALWPVL
ncbi:hypothetical protein [Caballeronia grimmiae]|nr:hypothetical protein [Caballeronia grimmiae]